MKILKQTLGLMAGLMAIIMLAGCAKDAVLEPAKPGSLNLSFTSSSLKSDALLHPSALIISIKDANNKAIFTNKRITLFDVNGSFTGEAMELAVGKYYIEEFMVVGDSNKVIYISPKIGSAKATLVKTALPIWFSVESGKTTAISPEVVRPEGQASDYGYAQFGFTIVDENPSTDSICLNIGSYNKMMINDGKLTIKSEAGVTSIPYYGGIISVTVPRSKTGYAVSLYLPVQNSYSKTITVSASDADKYSCSSGNFIDIFNTPISNEKCFESFTYTVSNISKKYSVTFTQDGAISTSLIQTYAAIKMSDSDLNLLDSIMRLSDVYNIKQSEVLCDIAWDTLEVYQIAGINQKNEFTAQYTGGCGVSKQAKLLNDHVRSLVYKYLSNYLQPNVSSDYVIKQGESFTLSLKSNATTGYSWTWANEKECTNLIGTSTYVTDNTQNDSAKIVGVGGTTYWTFTGTKTGSSTIILYYTRSWESTDPIDKRVITVTVQ